MSDQKPKAAEKSPAAPAAEQKPAAKTDLEERAELQTGILALERENKSLEGQLGSTSPEKLAELQALNKELKENLIRVEKELAAELLLRKMPLDAAGISDKLQVLKSEVLAYCADRQLDPGLWKNLESL